MAAVERRAARGRDRLRVRLPAQQDQGLLGRGGEALQEDDDLLGEFCQDRVSKKDTFLLVLNVVCPRSRAVCRKYSCVASHEYFSFILAAKVTWYPALDNVLSSILT